MSPKPAPAGSVGAWGVGARPQRSAVLRWKGDGLGSSSRGRDRSRHYPDRGESAVRGGVRGLLSLGQTLGLANHTECTGCPLR